ncbi:DNA ligase [Acrasis kona]|uniref:DNA ligase n=1 Tax=Acrasis kona TaxID=1008807 RepID=A0AAW2Z128_9EUKA
MGNNHTTHKINNIITIRYTFMPENTTGQINISDKVTLDEVQLLFGVIMPSHQGYGHKYECYDISTWQTIRNSSDWSKVLSRYIKSQTREPLHFRTTKKPLPLYQRRSSPQSNVHVMSTVRHGPQAKKVSAPTEFIASQITYQKPCKVSNDDLFDFVINREPEKRYVKTRRH